MSLTDPLIGKQLGDYRIVDMLGRGGMAHVYRGYDQKLQRYAAVKVIDSNLLAKDNEGEYRERFQREARAVAKLNHPNIVGVYQFGEVGALYYMAMVFLDGRDLGYILKDHVAAGTLMPHEQVLRIIHDIAGALDYAHAGGVIHRDIKPSNIMVTTEERAVLTDFGLALSVPEGTLGNTFGSAHYIAPEQAISSANAVPQSDLYSLGVVLFQMLTGKVPFDDPSAMSVALKHLSDPPPSPRSLNPSLSPAVEKVVLKSLEKEPSKRYQTGALMTQALQEALALDLPISSPSRPSRLFAPPLKKDETTSKPTIQFTDSQVAASQMRVQKARELLQGHRRKRKLWIGVGVVIILILISLSVFLLARGNSLVPATPTSAALVAVPTDTLPPASAVPTAALSSTSPPSPVSIVAITANVSATHLAATATTRPATKAVPTRSPVPTDGATVEATAEMTAASTKAVSTEAVTEAVNPDAPIQLIYDADKLVLVNRSIRDVSIRDWTFVQHSSLGDLSFFSAQWATPLLGDVRPNTCYLIWNNALSDIPTPSYCFEREAWYAAGVRSRFWVADKASVTFEVEDGNGKILATCPVNQGKCGVTPDA
ncbi:MAG TPA: protein kinase [Phototrophicaceae bacterium]|nr:protein kinase [Phototrophicaceae bacterium]